MSSLKGMFPYSYAEYASTLIGRETVARLQNGEQILCSIPAISTAQYIMQLFLEEFNARPLAQQNQLRDLYEKVKEVSAAFYAHASHTRSANTIQ